jgi:hypothetical protein
VSSGRTTEAHSSNAAGYIKIDLKNGGQIAEEVFRETRTTAGRFIFPARETRAGKKEDRIKYGFLYRTRNAGDWRMSIPAIHLTNWWRKLLLHVQILHTKDI